MLRGCSVVGVIISLFTLINIIYFLQRGEAYRVRAMSKGERIMAVIAEAATPTPREKSGYVESAISVRPGSGSERTAERKEPVQDSRVRRRTL